MPNLATVKDLEHRLEETYGQLRQMAERSQSGEWKPEDEETWKKVNADFDRDKAALEKAKRLQDLGNALAARSDSQPDMRDLAGGASSDPDDGGLDERSRRAIAKSVRRSLSTGESAPDSARGPLGMTVAHARALCLQSWCLRHFEGCESEPGPEHIAAEKWLAWEKRTRKESWYGQLYKHNYAARRRELMREIIFGRAWESRATMTTATDPEWIDETWERVLEKTMLYFGPMLQVADVRTTDKGNAYAWPRVNDTAQEGALVAEAAASTEQEATAEEIVLNAYKYTSKLVKISAELIEDSIFDLPSTIGELLGERLGRIVNRHLTTGTGSSQPQGIVTGATAVNTAGVATFAAGDIITLYYAVDKAYRAGGKFMANDAIIMLVRKFADTTGQYIWQPGLQAGQPDRLLGAELYTNNHMVSTTTTGSKILVFGDLEKFKVRRVKGVRMHRLVERYRDTDEEGFVGFIRVDSRVLVPSAIKVLNVA
jgi:HK97 family phage major capsid protein